MLDFVDSQNRRVIDTGLHVYIIGIFSSYARQRVLALGNGTDTPPTGVFILDPDGTVHITPQELPDKVLKTIIFGFASGDVYEPWVR